MTNTRTAIAVGERVTWKFHKTPIHEMQRGTVEAHVEETIGVCAVVRWDHAPEETKRYTVEIRRLRDNEKEES